ncbi:hypothetical protein AB1K83_04370 [Sporosarcina sp. 179-K 3D1 HS]|uniref:hypothetical protein n=1 Tax=Sporosarcina sp. 179-K 3D1 HS TaxID=3232169 RepID=UPI0039A008C8
MKKLMKILIVFVIMVIAIGSGVYYFGTKLIADQVMDQVAVELQNSGQLEAIKQEVHNDPQLKAFLDEGKNAQNANLPFHTKEEAVRVLLKKFDMTEIQELQSKAATGLSVEDKQELLNKMESRLTEEEMLALKVLAYKELAQ